MKKYIILLALFLSCSCAFANQYDDEENTRRFVDDLNKQEQAERDAAKQRYDDAHRSSDNGEGAASGLIIIFSGFACALWLHFKK